MDDDVSEYLQEIAYYDAARNDAVAKIILDALHAQDSDTYHGQASKRMGIRAMDAAAKVRETIAKEIAK